MTRNEEWAISESDGPETVERKIGHREQERLRKAARRHEFGRPEVTEIEVGSKTYTVATVDPMDVDGVRTMTVGSILWGVALLALLPFVGTLADDDRIWWLWTCVAGFGLGLIGLEYCRRRRNALRVQPGRRRAL